LVVFGNLPFDAVLVAKILSRRDAALSAPQWHANGALMSGRN
jgi:hypothetical protein